MLNALVKNVKPGTFPLLWPYKSEEALHRELDKELGVNGWKVLNYRH